MAEDLLVALGQPIDPRQDQAADRVRQLDPRRGRRRAPAAALLLATNAAGLDEGANELLDVQRVAFGAAKDEVADLGREVVDREQVADEGRRVPLLERREAHLGVALGVIALRGRAQVGRRRRALGTAGAHDQQRALGRRPKHVLDQRRRRRVGPVEILEDENERLRERDRGEEAAHHAEDLAAHGLAAEMPDRVVLRR